MNHDEIKFLSTDEIQVELDRVQYNQLFFEHPQYPLALHLAFIFDKHRSKEIFEEK